MRRKRQTVRPKTWKNPDVRPVFHPWAAPQKPYLTIRGRYWSKLSIM